MGPAPAFARIQPPVSTIPLTAAPGRRHPRFQTTHEPVAQDRLIDMGGTLDRALAAPSEMPPAGRRCALTPPYPHHAPLLHSLKRSDAVGKSFELNYFDVGRGIPPVRGSGS